MTNPSPANRALILGDIEGITRVDDWRHILSGHPGYDEACRAYEADVNAAVAGLLAGGASEVLVVDTHGSGDNVKAENLFNCRLLEGPSIMGRIDEAFAIGFDALVLLGFHVAAGTVDGFVPHSFAPQTRSWLNGTIAGEPAFYAHMAGAKGIPAIAITGDAQTIEQLRLFVPDAYAVQTKDSTSPWRSTSRPLQATHAELTATLETAYRNRGAIPALNSSEPLTLTVEAKSDVAATLVSMIPGTIPAGTRTASFTGPWSEVWRAFVTANSLATLSTSTGGSWYFGPSTGSLTWRLAGALGDAAMPPIGSYVAEQFSPPWGPACPPDMIPWNAPNPE